jgi:hypothetical protein
MLNDLPASPAEHTDYPHVRSSLRFPPDKSKTWLLVEGERKSATILDESFGGIGVTIDMEDTVNVHVGDQVVVFHYDYPTPAQVEWIRPDQEAKRIRLGIRWIS